MPRSPVRIVESASLAAGLPPLLAGRRFLLVTSAGAQARGWTRAAAACPGFAGAFARIPAHPQPKDAAAAARAVRDGDAELIVALGGGSVIDAAKAAAAVCRADDPEKELADALDGGALDAAHPLVAVPTTAGTGSEVTMWSTLWDHERGKKRSLAASAMFPEAALLIPELTYSLNYEQSLFPALDALSHALEALWNNNADAESDAAARRALSALLPVLAGAYPKRYADHGVRARLQRAAADAGQAISITRTALAHSISYPLTLRWGVPHGLACSFSLPEVFRYNAAAAPERAGAIARICGAADAAQAAAVLRGMLRETGADERLRGYVASRGAARELSGALITPGRADNNIAPAGAAEAARILEEALAAAGVPE